MPLKLLLRAKMIMAANWPQLEFTRPEWLWALLALPLLTVFYYRSLVDLPWRQMVLSLVVRTVVALLLIMALAGLNLLNVTREVFVVFALDNSLSVGADGQAAAVEFISEATKDADEKQFAVLPFATAPGSFGKLLPGSSVDDKKPSDGDNTDNRELTVVDLAESLRLKKWKQGD